VRETLAFHWQGAYLNSPNDVVIRSDGTIDFSDPWYGRMAAHGLERPRELGWQGVFRLPPGGGPDDLDLAVPEDELPMPNGLCFSPDESLLHVDDTPRAHVKVWDVQPDGRLENGRVFLEGVGAAVWVTGPGGVWVVSPQREHLGVVQMPETASNLAWGGPDWHTLFVTASTSVYAVRTIVGPRPEPHMRSGANGAR
jgi:gluconolactonase